MNYKSNLKVNWHTDNTGDIPITNRKDRIKICETCENLLIPAMVCKQCGCFMPVKTWFKTSKCPKGKW